MTGLSSGQLDALVAGVFQHIGLWQVAVGRRRRLGLYRAVVMVLCHLRQNIVQDVLGELFGCSQPTVSRTVAKLGPVIAAILKEHADRIAAREMKSTTRVDGFLAKVGNHRTPERKKGMWCKRRSADGFNIQVITSREGRLILVGRPIPGSTHDAKAWRASGLAARFRGRLHRDGGPGVIGDLGYLGTGALTGFRRRPGRPLSISERQFNRSLNSWRAPVEGGIAHLKAWKILATGYRGLLCKFAGTLETITALEIYRTWSTL